MSTEGWSRTPSDGQVCLSGNRITLHPDGQSLASGSSSGSVKMWSLSLASCVRNFAGHKTGSAVYSVAFSPDGNFLASGSHDCTVRLLALEFAFKYWKVMKAKYGPFASPQMVAL